jgi:deazaflavin-dependent oxidoreductase (nitroreductase family)
MHLTATADIDAKDTGPPRAVPKALARPLLRLINKIVDPLVRLGFVSPHAGPGLVVVETTGNRTGLPRRVPLFGLRAGESVIVSTFRPNSTWVRNLEDHPQAEFWSGGIRRRATAVVHRLSTGAYVRLDATSRSRPCFT